MEDFLNNARLAHLVENMSDDEDFFTLAEEEREATMGSALEETGQPICDRIPTLQDLEHIQIVRTNDKENQLRRNNYKQRYMLKDDVAKKIRRDYNFYNFCVFSVCLSFVFGLVVGILLVGTSNHMSTNRITVSPSISEENLALSRNINKLKNTAKELEVNKDFPKVSFANNKFAKEHSKDKQVIYPKSLTEDMKEILKDQKVVKHDIKLNETVRHVNDKTILFDNIYWGPGVENLMPQGYGMNSADIWESYVSENEVIKMEEGCGRMQNRLVTFQDGIQACVRYRQNTDQIQGEIFSFYVAGLLNLTNLAPSVVKAVDLKDKLWKNVANEIATAEWASNRAVVLTRYIPSLEPAKIPEVFKPSTRHLDKHDVYKMVTSENESILKEKLKSKKYYAKKEDNVEIFDHVEANLNKKAKDLFVELAQWSDLIIFDYLTANLDRIVNNLFNFQWNINIMDGPAHNLAKKIDSGLLIFLDNESGLLHGYRLLKKYDVYHSVMLDNLCVFRKRTIDALKRLYNSNVGLLVSDIFHRKNNAVIRDILPPLPEKNAKILHERIGSVLSQVEKCVQKFDQ